MYLPRSLITHLYLHLLKTHHSRSPQVLILVALEPDALCACRILTGLLKHDYINHKIHPVAGYGDLSRAGAKLIQPMRTNNGGDGGVVICLGVGGTIDLGEYLGLCVSKDEPDGMGGVEVWVLDARRPWNLGNVFAGRPSAISGNGSSVGGGEGVENGRIQQSYKPGRGGIIVFDDGDIEEELGAEQHAYCKLEEMPEVDEDEDYSEASETESESGEASEPSIVGVKRKSFSDSEEGDGSDDEDSRPRQRRRSNSSSSIASLSRPRPRGLLMISSRLSDDSHPNSSSDRSSTPPISQKQPSARALRRRLVKLHRKYKGILRSYYDLGSSYSEPVSSLMYSLVSELGKEDNDFLWYAIVGVGSLELYGRDITGVGTGHKGDETGGLAGWSGQRGRHIRQLLRDEVRRLNPPKVSDLERDAARGESHGVIPTTARSPTDTSIRLSPEPKFLLIRHWSLYDSMLHSPYLASRLHIWSDAGRKRLHKLLAKMGVSLTQCKQNYAHMDMNLKRGLRERLLKYAPLYGLDDLVPPVARADTGGKEGWGFVRSWGWKACLSANDVAVIIGAMLEVGKDGVLYPENGKKGTDRRECEDEDGVAEGESFALRFWGAYDGLKKYEYLVEKTLNDDTYGEHSVDALKAAIPTAIHLHRAILRTGTSLIEKGQIRYLRAFRMAVVRDGPDVSLFTHPSALTKLALWLGEAIAEQERGQKGKLSNGGRGTPLVVAGLNEYRGVYVIVGTGGGGRAADLQNKAEEKRKKEEKLKAKEAKRSEKEKRRREQTENMSDEEAEEEESDTDSSDDDELEDIETETRGYGKSRFGNAFQAVLKETGARVRIDSFDHCVAEVKKEDLSGFLESLSMKAVIG
ncbi:hypothetical protein GP486_001176 [Trichoglossum hirsutum]|uniref:CDC45-like protein n=1 Tax=Trichoglossum hirsutum TaxID=265104 RepID=A0A9P8RSU9_9PEZI|nr:hypothetical protein GP486_001176 [Trichoglossum hirsutum]